MGTATKHGIVANDLLLGQGTVEQTRGNTTATEEKINAGVIPYVGEPGDVDYESIKDRMDAIDPDVVTQNTLDIATNVIDIADNTTNIEQNTEAIANLATAQGSIVNDATPSVAAIPTVTPVVLSFDEVTASTDENVFTIDDTTETITYLQDASFNFSSSVKFTSSTASVVTVSFDLVDVSDDTVLGTQEVVLNTASGQSTTIPLNTLLTVGKNGIPSAPLTIRIEVSADIAGYSVDSFSSVLASSSSYDVTTEASGINYDNTTSELAGENVQDAIDEIVAKGSPSDVITNGLITSGALALQTTEVTGSVPIIYTGNGTTKDIPTPMQIANDDGQSSTLAIDWVSLGSYALGKIVIDNSATGDARAYRCISTVVDSAISPILDEIHWVLETNQYGGRFWFKDRGSATSHELFDSVRRENNTLQSNSTNIEFQSGTLPLSTFNVNSIGLTNGGLNTNTNTYVLWIDQTTRKTAGYRTDAGVIQNSKNNTGTDLMELDSAGNPIIEHYNPTTGFSIIMDTGNGVAGRTIPHSLQSKPSVIIKKVLTTNLRSWLVYNNASGATKYMFLDAPAAAALDTLAWNDTEPTDYNYTVGSGVSGNQTGEQHITYLQTDSANHYTGAYTAGTTGANTFDIPLDLSISGSFIGYKPLSTTGDWDRFDNVRGVTKKLEANTSAAETTETAIVMADGSVTLNLTSGVQYLIQAYSPKYAQPTGGSLIDVNPGVDLTYTQGIGQTNLQETTLAHIVDCSAFAGDTAYVLKERGSDAIGFATGLPSAQSRGDIVGYYLNTLDKVVYDSGDIVTSLVALGECKVDSQTNVFDLVEYEPLHSYFNGATFTGEVNLNGNVKAVNFGIVFNNQRITLDNPFGNDSIVETEVLIFDNEVWANPYWFDEAGVRSGVRAGAIAGKGIVVQSAEDNVKGTSSSSGSLHGSSSVLSAAPCIVMVAKIAEEYSDA